MEHHKLAHVPAVDRVPPDAATVVGMATFPTRNIGGLRGRVSSPGERVVQCRRKNKTLVEIGKRLRGQGEETTREPLPQGWVDLIHHLNEQERKRSNVLHQKLSPPCGLPLGESDRLSTDEIHRRRNKDNCCAVVPAVVPEWLQRCGSTRTCGIPFGVSCAR